VVLSVVLLLCSRFWISPWDFLSPDLCSLAPDDRHSAWAKVRPGQTRPEPINRIWTDLLSEDHRARPKERPHHQAEYTGTIWPKLLEHFTDNTFSEHSGYLPPRTAFRASHLTRAAPVPRDPIQTKHEGRAHAQGELLTATSDRLPCR